MKKIAFSLFVAFIISLATVAASALVLTDDWKNAETTDLEAAVREIQKEISQRLTKDGTATVFSGHGDFLSVAHSDCERIMDHHETAHGCTCRKYFRARHGQRSFCLASADTER